jgi:hypothetical protein
VSAVPAGSPAVARAEALVADSVTLPRAAAQGAQPLAGLPAPAGRWSQALDAQAPRLQPTPGLEAAAQAARAGAPPVAPRAFGGPLSATVSGLVGGEPVGDAGRRGEGTDLPGLRVGDGNATVRASAQAALASSAVTLDPTRTLQFAPLGPGIDLMVGPEPEPAMQDLLEFARASGIGADALERLFGPQASSASRLGGAVPQAAVPLPGALASATVAPPWLAAASREDARVELATAGPQGGLLDVEGVDFMPVSVPREQSDFSAPPVLSSAGAAPPSPATPPAPAQAMAGAPVPPVSYAEMSNRVAHAVASRMVAGLREGSGSLRLQLEPQSLGRVEVQMALQDGRLEATIAAHQAGTRDLLNDGIMRLRETLGQLGMNVAVVHVIDGSGGRGDGKPTRQRSADTPYARQGTGPARVEGASEGGRPGRGVSGLDVWA